MYTFGVACDRCLSYCGDMTKRNTTADEIIAAAKRAVETRIEAFEVMVKYGDISPETGEACLRALRGARFRRVSARVVVASAPSRRASYLVCECLDAGAADVPACDTGEGEISGDGPSYTLTW